MTGNYKSPFGFNFYNQSVTSHGQSGGITAHTVNVGSPQRVMDSGLKQQILSDLPRDKPITVTAVMGDAEAFRLAHEVHAFLKANNFPLTEDGVSQSMFSVPVEALHFNVDTSSFIVGSAPR